MINNLAFSGVKLGAALLKQLINDGIAVANKIKLEDSPVIYLSAGYGLSAIHKRVKGIVNPIPPAGVGFESEKWRSKALTIDKILAKTSECSSHPGKFSAGTA